MSEKLNVIYMGSAYRPLEKLLNDPSIHVGAVYSRENPILKDPRKSYPFINDIEEICEQKNIQIDHPAKISDPSAYSAIVNANPNFIISCGYHQLLPKEIINSAKIAAINIHPGKLPEYKGQSVIEWALINNESNLYMTIHELTEKFDDGDILMEQAIAYTGEDNGSTMQGKLYTAAADMMMQFIKDPKTYLNAKKKHSGEGKYHHRIKESDYKIDWNDTTGRNANIARAMVYPRDGAYSFIDGEKIIIDCIEMPRYTPPPNKKPGEIVSADGSILHVATPMYMNRIDIKNIRNYHKVHDKLRVGKIFE